jgi:hypothetical protein
MDVDEIEEIKVEEIAPVMDLDIRSAAQSTTADRSKIILDVPGAPDLAAMRGSVEDLEDSSGSEPEDRSVNQLADELAAFCFDQFERGIYDNTIDLESLENEFRVCAHIQFRSDG